LFPLGKGITTHLIAGEGGGGDHAEQVARTGYLGNKVNCSCFALHLLSPHVLLQQHNPQQSTCQGKWRGRRLLPTAGRIRKHGAEEGFSTEN